MQPHRTCLSWRTANASDTAGLLASGGCGYSQPHKKAFLFWSNTSCIGGVWAAEPPRTPPMQDVSAQDNQKAFLGGLRPPSLPNASLPAVILSRAIVFGSVMLNPSRSLPSNLSLRSKVNSVKGSRAGSVSISAFKMEIRSEAMNDRYCPLAVYNAGNGFHFC